MYFTISDLLRHFFDRRWVVAHAFFPNPEPMTFPEALIGCIAEGGRVHFIS